LSVKVEGVNLDLGQVQAFVAAADHLHFGRAANTLHITQQGLSHRIGRLEQLLNQQLFVRNGRAVELTAAGHRFLPRARELLETAQAAIAEARDLRRPLRADVWGQPHAPLSWIRKLSKLDPDLHVDVTMRRSTAAAIEALLRGEIDVAFGRIPDDEGYRLPEAIHHHVVNLSPQGVLVGAGHALAHAHRIHPADLAHSGLSCPSRGTPAEILGYARQFAARFEIPLDESGINLGLEHLVADLRERTTAAVLCPVDLALPAAAEVCHITMTDPVPMFAWSMIWRRDDPDEALLGLRRGIARLSKADDWPTWDPARHWLPDSDLTAGFPR
jgi:DNA-binding transcriptional LysR family regulator